MPNRDDVRRALAVMRRDVDRRYFFAKLTSPAWITPLVDEGLFSSPPPVQKSGDYLQFPDWPALEYLARVAGQSPEEAAKILRTVPRCDNPRVHMDLVDVALQVAVDDAAEWARGEVTWIQAQGFLYIGLPEKYALLTRHLAESKQIVVASELAGAVLAPQPESRESEETEFSFPPQPRSKFDRWEYRETARGIADALAAASPMVAVELFGSLLDKALRLSMSPRSVGLPSDFSSIWRDAIEDDEGGSDEVRDVLVTCMRDVATEGAKTVGCEAITSYLAGQSWDVFRRIALHVLRVACSSEIALLKSRVLDKQSFFDATIHHEYVLLLRDRFSDLEPEEREEVLAWIEKGRDYTTTRERLEADGEDLTPELEASYREQWQRDRLAPLTGKLPPEWQRRLQDLLSRHGPPVFDLVQHRSWSGFVAERAPITAEELSALDGKALREFLQMWTPPEGHSQPTVRGLVDALRTLDVSRFLHEVEAAPRDWAAVKSPYSVVLVDKLREALKTGTPLPWNEILDFLSAAVETVAVEWDDRWLRQATMDLLKDAFELTPAPVTLLRARERAWHVIERVLQNERGVTEDSVSASESEPLTRAINNPAGRALEAAIRYCVWIRRNEQLSSWRLETHAPEAGAVLEEWSNPETLGSHAARAIFGAHLGGLVWLDSAWVKAHLGNLLPHELRFQRAHDAVWRTYLVYSSPTREAFRILKGEYDWAIANRRDEETATARVQLAEHIVRFYWNGMLSLESDTVRHLFDLSSVHIRRHAIEFTGRTLLNATEIDETAIRLCSALFDWRLKDVLQIENDAERSHAALELEPFGWWFASKRLTPSWALQRAIEVLNTHGRLEPSYLVAEEYERLVSEFPSLVGEAVLLTLAKAAPDHELYSLRDHMGHILSVLVTKEYTVDLASRIVDALLERSLGDYRNMLPRASK